MTAWPRWQEERPEGTSIDILPASALVSSSSASPMEQTLRDIMLLTCRGRLAWAPEDPAATENEDMPGAGAGGGGGGTQV